MKKEDVLDYVDPNYVLSLTQQLIRIPSESTGQNERSKDRGPLVALIQEQFKTLGLETKLMTVIEGRPNIVVELKGQGDGKTLMIFSHADTIEVTDLHMKMWHTDPFEGRLKDGKLYGVGSADTKGGVASVIGAVKAIVESGTKFNGKIIVLFQTYGESAAPGGIKELVKHDLFPKADGAIIADASDRKIIKKFKGRMWLEFVVFGKSAHACEPEAGINAIEKAIKVIEGFKRTRFTEHTDPDLGETRMTLTGIEAMSVPSSIPGRCRLVFDMRWIPGITSSQLLKKIQDVLESLMKDDQELKVVMSVFPGSIKEVCETPANDPIVLAIARAMEKVLGKVEYFPGIMTTGASTFWSKNIPVVFFGPGSIFNAHVPNEHIEVTRLEEATKIYIMTALNFLGIPD